MLIAEDNEQRSADTAARLGSVPRSQSHRAPDSSSSRLQAPLSGALGGGSWNLDWRLPKFAWSAGYLHAGMYSSFADHAASSSAGTLHPHFLPKLERGSERSERRLNMERTRFKEAIGAFANNLRIKITDLVKSKAERY